MDGETRSVLYSVARVATVGSKAGCIVEPGDWALKVEGVIKA